MIIFSIYLRAPAYVGGANWGQVQTSVDVAHSHGAMSSLGDFPGIRGMPHPPTHKIAWVRIRSDCLFYSSILRISMNHKYTLLSGRPSHPPSLHVHAPDHRCHNLGPPYPQINKYYCFDGFYNKIHPNVQGARRLNGCIGVPRNYIISKL